MSAETKHHWTVVATAPPSLTKRQWYLSSLVGIVFLAVGILQLINFQGFSDNLSALEISSSNFWGGAIVFAELWAAAGFFKLRLSRLFRAFSNFFAVVMAGFWFVESIRQAAMAPDAASPVSNMNYFGHFFAQAPGWWTILEATVFIFLVLYLLELFKKVGTRPPVVTKVTRRSGKKEVKDV